MPLTAAAAAAAAGAGVVVWLLLPSRNPSSGPVGRRPRTRFAIWTGPLGALGLVALTLSLLVDGSALALLLITVGALSAATRLVALGKGRQRAHRRADSVVEACEALSGELRAGRPPGAALRHCVDVWPELEPVAAAADIGGDVPRALRRLAGLPGASALREVASAWQVSESSGATMAHALGRVAEAARRRRATQQLISSELASAQATARLVAVLPVAVLSMGSGLGGDPWRFLLSTPAGLTCLGAGLVLAFAGLAWIDNISTSALDP